MTHEAFGLTVTQPDYFFAGEDDIAQDMQLERYGYRFIYRNAITDEERLVSFVLDTDAFAEVADAKKVALKEAGIKLGIWGEVDGQSQCLSQWDEAADDDLF